jgi:hypothetical protein
VIVGRSGICVVKRASGDSRVSKYKNDKTHVHKRKKRVGVLQTVPSIGVCALKGDVMCKSTSMKRCHTATVLRLSSLCGMCTSVNIATRRSCTAT